MIAQPLTAPQVPQLRQGWGLLGSAHAFQADDAGSIPAARLLFSIRVFGSKPLLRLVFGLPVSARACLSVPGCETKHLT